MTEQDAPINKQPKILFVGQALYNAWYLSRALRKKGCYADLLDIDSNLENQAYYHGTDFSFNQVRAYERLEFFIHSLDLYDIFHFSNNHGMHFVTPWYRNKETLPWQVTVVRFVWRFVIQYIVRGSIRNFKLLCSCGMQRILAWLLDRCFWVLPPHWDVLLLKDFGKKIVYSNNGCMDGVLQSSFIRWGDERVCEDCGWYRVPIVCCDEKNDYWGKVRNELADFQVTTGGNRVDYNDDPRVHEVPEFYCMDPELWNPDLLVPTNYRIALPVDCVKILHAVGNFDKRTSAKEKRNIKSTHIYLALMDELKAEGHNVELVFLKDVPNKQFRFYQAQVDIVVDMLTYGFFGANVREAMMMGKPCVCYLRQEWLETMRREVPEYVEELPVISATPASIKMILTDLIIHPEKRKEIGEKSREFAVKWHSADAGAKRMIQIYEELSNVTNSSSSRATRG